MHQKIAPYVVSLENRKQQKMISGAGSKQEPSISAHVRTRTNGTDKFRLRKVPVKGIFTAKIGIFSYIGLLVRIRQCAAHVRSSHKWSQKCALYLAYIVALFIRVGCLWELYHSVAGIGKGSAGQLEGYLFMLLGEVVSSELLKTSGYLSVIIVHSQ